MSTTHPAISAVLQDSAHLRDRNVDRNSTGPEQTTSLTLARALAVGCLSRLDPGLKSLNVWDPAAGSGFAGLLLTDALRSNGVHVSYRGQDIREHVVSVSRQCFKTVPDAAIAVGNSLVRDEFDDFQADLVIVDAPWGQRESVWVSPESAEDVVNRIAGAFDDSLSSWLDELPFPVASALWTAETASTPGEQQRAYINAWEAIVTFHAIVLLAASRTDPGKSIEVEAAIRQTLRDQHLGIEYATFGTWVIIIERVTKELRRALTGDADEIARVRRTFAGMSQAGIERLTSKQLVKKLSEVNRKRNRWLGHAGYTSNDEWKRQVVSLEADLSELRQILGSVWTQLLLVRAGGSELRRDGRVQTAEIAVGTRSPFKTEDFRVGEEMIHGDLYLVRQGSQSPLRLGQFVQLRAAPRDAQYTTYFYNRTDGASVRMISYQYGPESEIQDDVEGFRSEFGGLALG